MSVVIINSTHHDQDEEEEDNEIELEEDEVEEEDEEEVEEEDEAEAEVDEDEEEEEDEEVEEVDEIEEDLDIDEVEVEEVDEIEEEDDSSAIDLRDIINAEPTYKKKRVKIQRYCKSSKEFEPRSYNQIELNPFLFENIVSQYTSKHNASKFTNASIIDRDMLYQLCGKFMNKTYPFSDLYKETNTHTSNWDSKTFSKEMEEEKHELSIMTVKLSVSEGLYQCGRCKSKKTFSRQVQTRSADEGMTSIIQCSECNKVWREYA